MQWIKSYLGWKNGSVITTEAYNRWVNNIEFLREVATTKQGIDFSDITITYSLNKTDLNLYADEINSLIDVYNRANSGNPKITSVKVDGQEVFLRKVIDGLYVPSDPLYWATLEAYMHLLYDSFVKHGLCEA